MIDWSSKYPMLERAVREQQREELARSTDRFLANLRVVLQLYVWGKLNYEQGKEDDYEGGVETVYVVAVRGGQPPMPYMAAHPVPGEWIEWTKDIGEARAYRTHEEARAAIELGWPGGNGRIGVIPVERERGGR